MSNIKCPTCNAWWDCYAGRDLRRGLYRVQYLRCPSCGTTSKRTVPIEDVRRRSRKRRRRA